MAKKNNRTAFSLVEISIVLLIIGILVSGIIGGKRILQRARLSDAKAATQTSGLTDIDDLVVWYETSLEDSFDNAGEGNRISLWHNHNLKSESKNDAIQATAASQPIFHENRINNAIPALSFDGSSYFLNFDGAFLVNSSYTIFVVEQRCSNAALNPFLGSVGSSLNQNLFVGYSSNTTVGYSQHQNNNGINFAVSGYSSPVPTIHSFMLNNVYGLRYWRNGAANVSVSDGTKTSNISSLSGLAIGRFSQDGGSTYSYFNGDMAEIIIFKRSLKSDEKKAVEFYLGRKYGITVGN